jgi:hypothetical protein
LIRYRFYTLSFDKLKAKKRGATKKIGQPVLAHLSRFLNLWLAKQPAYEKNATLYCASVAIILREDQCADAYYYLVCHPADKRLQWRLGN